MRITKEGRLCAAVAFSRVNGDSLESQFVDMSSVPIWDSFSTTVAVFDHAMVGCHAMAGVSGGHWDTQDGMSVMR